MISEQSLWNILDGIVKLRGGQKGAARAMGISQQYLCDVLHGRRKMGAKMLTALGYKRKVMYERSR